MKQKIHSQFREVFRTPDGKAVLKELEAQFYRRDMQGKSEHETLINVGAHKVVNFIHEMMEQADE